MNLAQKHSSAKYAFLYVLALIALVFISISFGNIAFEMVNYYLPETTWSYSGSFSQDSLRFAISALLVAAPFYYFATRQINKDLANNKLSRDAGVRRWLTYLILLVAITTTIGFLIAILYNFLNGELTTKFLLKSLAAILIAAGFGSYYAYDLYRKKVERNNVIRTFSILFLLVLVASLVLAFSFIDSPQKVKELREDENRVSDLQNIAWRIGDYYRDNQKLPEKLEILVEEMNLSVNKIQDPVTKESYTYEILGKEDYKLCAEFKHSNLEEDLDYPVPDWKLDPDWSHGVGEQCFEIQLKKDNERIDFSIKPAK